MTTQRCYYKITNDDETLDMSDRDCLGGELYFTDLQNIGHWGTHGVYLIEVTVPPDSVIIREKCGTKYKSQKIELGKRILINSEEFVNLLFNTSDINNDFIRYKLLQSDDPEKQRIACKLIADDKYMSPRDDVFLTMHSLKVVDSAHILECIINNSLLLNKTSREITYACIWTQNQKIFAIIRDFIAEKASNKVTYDDNIIDVEAVRLNIIQDLTNKFGEEFCKTLAEHNAVISGSYVLAKLTNDRFVYNDIDIYVNITRPNRNVNPQGADVLVNLLKKHIKKAKTSFVRSLDYVQLGTILNIKGTLNTTSKIKVQIIYIKYNCETFEKFFGNNFDFNFCTAWFDGKNLDHSKIARELTLSNIYNGHIMTPYIDACKKILIGSIEMHTASKTLERLVKYATRGFVVNNALDFLEIMANLKKPEDLRYRGNLV